MTYRAGFKCPQCGGRCRSDRISACATCTPGAAVNAVLDLLQHLDIETRPKTTLCPVDGCLLAKGEECPACEAARLCGCGTRIRRAGAEKCHNCRKKVARNSCTGCGKWVRVAGEERCHACRSKTEKPRCGCGRQIRADGQTECSPCRRHQRRNTIPDETDTCPVRWVRSGLIWRPVYEQSEVA